MPYVLLLQVNIKVITYAEEDEAVEEPYNVMLFPNGLCIWLASHSVSNSIFMSSTIYELELELSNEIGSTRENNTITA